MSLFQLSNILSYEQPTKYLVDKVDKEITSGIPVLTAGKSFILGYTNDENNCYHASVEDPVIIFDDFTTSTHLVTFDFKVKSSAIKLLKISDEFKDKADIRFVYNKMKTINYNVVNHERHWIKKYSMMKIDLPDLEEQKRIVSILNNFDELIDLLETELDLRKKQLNYYRKELLS